jgi:protein arginine N-methyltransferase 1
MTAAYQAEEVGASWSEQLLTWGDDFHDLMLGDALRMRAYRAAVHEVVRPGDVVVDVGTGTGVLARWALEAGAARAYGIERDHDLLDRAVAAAAAFGGRFVPVPGLSFDVTLPERADVLVSEVLGNLVDNEGSTRILADATRRFLRPGARLLPRRCERYLVPVDAPRAHAAVAALAPGGRFDAYYDVILPRAGYLASPRLDRAFEAGDDTVTYGRDLVFPLDRAGMLTGLKGWFVVDLSPTVALDISGDRIDPAAERTTSDSWRHAYLPIAEPVAVEPFDRLALRFERRAGGAMAGDDGDGDGDPFAQSYRWTGTVWRGDDVVGRFDHRS